MKTYQYSVSTSVIWSSFDFGTVEAQDIQEARDKALEKLKNDFSEVNKLLSLIGHTIDFNKDAVEVIEL
jgi:ribosomal protein S5